MGAPDGADGGVGAGCGVGTIVWVRRRNGSWWPGRILGQEELSASHLMSPRSGTPVKLLGREDASVDWYNLEKSKRVKAFRCGEFDACIERAEASQGVLSKKREKYARRQDAILHALELEKQQKSGVDTNHPSHKYSSGFTGELGSHSFSELCLKDDELIALGKSVNPKAESYRKVDFPSEVVSRSRSSPLNTRKCENGKQIDRDDDNSEVMPHLRGLQDLDLCIVPSKMKDASFIVCESSKAALVSNSVDVVPGSGHSIGHVSNVGSSKIPLLDKRKRSHGGVLEEYFVKRRDRCHPLVQELQNSAKLPTNQSLQADSETVSLLGQEENEHTGTICHVNRSRCTCLTTDSSECLDHTGGSSDHMQLSPTQVGCSNGLHHPGSLSDEVTSCELIKEETGSSERELMDSGMEDGTILLQDCVSFVPVSRSPERHIRQGVSTLGDEEKLGKICGDYETSIPGCKADIFSNDGAAGTADMGVSKWHMKGKRNIRNLTKRSMEVLDGKSSVMSSDNCNGYLSRLVHEKNKKRGISTMGHESISGQDFYDTAEEPNYAYDDDDKFSKTDLKNRFVGFGKHSYPLMIKAASKEDSFCGTDDDFHEMFSSSWEADDPPYLALRPSWAESDECMGTPFVCRPNVEMEPLLLDVNLRVQASYHGAHVPLVSLMSRLNGKAIVGHPVHIEILEDGLTNFLLPRNDNGPDTTGGVKHVSPPHVWRTGRRTAMQRVPRPHLAPSAREGSDAELIPCTDKELFKKPHTVTHQASSMKMSSHQCWPTLGKSHEKLSWEGSLSSQKTRKLSSISVEQKHNNVNISAKQKRNSGCVLDGLIKPGAAVPLVACVPVKVVFSRLLEAVGRPVSADVLARPTELFIRKKSIIGSLA